MSCAHYHNNELCIENVRLEQIAAEFGTPCYIYSEKRICDNWQLFRDAFKNKPHRICYAVKANSNIAILNLLANLDAHFDIVSGGELERVLAAHGQANKIIFSGVGKQITEIKKALQKKIYCFNVESAAELERLDSLCTHLKTPVNIALRINPNIQSHTHDYITTGRHDNKFGIEKNEIFALCEKLKNHSYLRLIGLACHIGSQITQLQPFENAIDVLLEIYEQLNNFEIQHINIGGGLGIIYHQEQPPSVQSYAATVLKKLANLPIEIILEPGRSIVGNAGILLTRVEYLKHQTNKNFAIVDAGMNDLLRPALYQAWQNILPVIPRQGKKQIYDIAGPVCESADFLGKNREMILSAGDLLAIENAGAYGFSMSSNYNSRCRPAEILVSNDQYHLIRQRETIAQLLSLENMISKSVRTL